MSDFGIVIPARFGSSRLPGKPLREIAGKPMIQWVWENAKQAGAEFVFIATDDARIEAVAQKFGAEVVMTSADHATGTDRLAEVVAKRQIPEQTIVVNVQGDEPLLAAKMMQLVAHSLAEFPEAGISTLANPITEASALFSPHAVKVVLDARGFALYFSRAPIPWDRDAFTHGVPQKLPDDVRFLRHVGLYAYRAGALKRLSQEPQTLLEKSESLEQLRALHLGIPIVVSVVDEQPAHGVDTEEDLLVVAKSC